MAAPKKKKTITAVKAQNESSKPKAQVVQATGNATGLRIGAVALWLVALGFEVLALLFFNGTIKLNFLTPMWLAIIALVLDLVCVIIGSILWKKSNRIDPASEKNKLKFWLWNNMGLIACTLAFVPFIILALTDKKADKKSKTIVSIVAVIALLIGGLVSYDWNPVSREDLEAAKAAITGDVYWVKSGDIYHTSSECSYLNNTENLSSGSVEAAFENGHIDLCSRCAKRDGIEGVRTNDYDPFAETTPVETTLAE